MKYVYPRSCLEVAVVYFAMVPHARAKRDHGLVFDLACTGALKVRD